MDDVRRLNILLPAMSASLLTWLDKSRLPTLNTLLSRAEAQPELKLHAAYPQASLLFQLFAYPQGAESDRPIAALMRLADGLPAASDVQVLTPTNWILGRDTFYFGPCGSELAITPLEAIELVCSLNQSYADDGYVFDYSESHRWYVQGLPKQGKALADPHTLTGQAVRQAMPAKDQGLFWQQWLNEVQMLFYSQELNQQREMSGAYTINSVWPWGAGSLSDPWVSPWQQVFGKETLLQGLAMHCELEYSQALNMEQALKGSSLIAPEADSLQNPPDEKALTGRLQAFEAQILVPAFKALKSGQVDELYITSREGACFRLTRRMLGRWWRRNRPLTQYLQGQVE